MNLDLLKISTSHNHAVHGAVLAAHNMCVCAHHAQLQEETENGQNMAYCASAAYGSAMKAAGFTGYTAVWPTPTGWMTVKGCQTFHTTVDEGPHACLEKMNGAQAEEVDE